MEFFQKHCSLTAFCKFYFPSILCSLHAIDVQKHSFSIFIYYYLFMQFKDFISKHTYSYSFFECLWIKWLNWYSKRVESQKKVSEEKRILKWILGGKHVRVKVRKMAKISNQYNQVPNLTQDTTWEVNKNAIKHHKQEPRDQPFPSR